MKASRNGLSVVLCFIAGCFTFFIAGCAAGRHTANDVKVKTRENISVKLEVYEPKGMTAKGVALMLPGGGGQIAGSNYVVRETPRFVEQGYAVAIMDVPSNLPNIPVEFRWSLEHQQDIKKVVAYIKQRYPQKPLFMIAFSNGNFSAVRFPVFYPEEELAGTIFMAAPWEAMIMSCMTAQTFYPVLIVQHENDMCAYCNFKGAKICYKYMNTKGRKDLLAVRYGTLTNRLGDQCGPYHYHAFEGQEEKVTKAVVDWMDGREIPAVIE